MRFPKEGAGAEDEPEVEPEVEEMDDDDSTLGVTDDADEVLERQWSPSSRTPGRRYMTRTLQSLQGPWRYSATHPPS